MGYFAVSERPMMISDQVNTELIAWQRFPSLLWALLCAAISCTLVAMFLRRRVTGVPIMQKVPEKSLPNMDKESVQHSPFFVYLDHNAITESEPQNVGNTSGNAIDRITEHIKSRNAMAALAAEPDLYNSGQSDNSVGKGKWRSYSYTDTPRRQLSFRHVRHMRDEESGRQWSRRTMQFCGI